jgi:iron complex transport system permease protein
MILAGIAISFIFSSLLMFLQFFSDTRHSFQIVRWLMGGIEVFGYGHLTVMAPLVIIAAVIVFVRLAHLDQLMTGEDIAQSRGVEVRKTKNLLLIAASLAVAAIVSVCGPIGFVGMMVPHICRLLVGPSHRILGPVSFVVGGGYLVACDTIARVVVAPAEMPVGVITALMGGPFFLWLLFKKSREYFV